VIVAKQTPSFVSEEVEQHLAAVETTYAPLIVGDDRLKGGARLWGQFEDAVASYRGGRTTFAAVYERINELAVARLLLIDHPQCQILYEPPIAADGSRVDFVVPGAVGGNLYTEVKTVRPTTEDSEENWRKFEKRREYHPANVKYVVAREMLGAEIYGNSFSARSKFLEYVYDFEPKLAATNSVQPGRGWLIFCGTAWGWHRSHLEDFADFYRTGKHREDDAFADMEAADLRSGRRPPLQHNIAGFGFLKRHMDDTTGEGWTPDVRGPTRFR
jgi:hypothetical protein